MRGLPPLPLFKANYYSLARPTGDIVPIANPVTPPINASAIPPFDGAAGSSYIQILLSSYTFETAIYTFYKVIILTCPVPPSRGSYIGAVLLLA